MTVTQDSRIDIVRRFHEAADELGWFPVLVLCAEDVADTLRSRVSDDEMPSDEDIYAAADRVSRKAELPDAYEAVMDWACELAAEYRATRTA